MRDTSQSIILLLFFVSYIYSYQIYSTPRFQPGLKQDKVKLCFHDRFLFSSRLSSQIIKSIRTRIHDTNEKQTKSSLYMTKTTDGPWKTWNIPTWLTLGRILAIPLFLISFIFENKALGLFLFVLSSLTDLLDGYLARIWNQTTEFGAFLDPVADKLMVASALSLLTCNLPVWWFAIPVALVLCREIGVSALREWMSAKGLRNIVQVGVVGKWKTALQMISITLLLASSSPDTGSYDQIETTVGLAQSMILSVGLLGFYLSTILTIYSGYQYFKAAWPSLQPKSTTSSRAEIVTA